MEVRATKEADTRQAAMVITDGRTLSLSSALKGKTDYMIIKIYETVMVSRLMACNLCMPDGVMG